MITNKVKYFLVFIMLLVGIRPVLADTNDNIVDFSKKGSISITLSEIEEDLPVSGAYITIYKVAEAYSLDSNLAFKYNDNLKDYEDYLKDGNVTEEILEVMNENVIPSFSDITNELGRVTFDDLDLGLYLVVQTNKVTGFSSIDPFLIFIPKVIDNKWTYDIEATPKVDIIRLFDLTVEKVWNVSDNVNIPSEVIVELLKDDKVIDTIVLNKENDWTYVWSQIEKSDEYEVREKEIPVGYTATYEKEDNKFIIINTRSLVQTGKNNLISPIFAVFGVIFIVIGLMIEKRNKYE